MNHYRNYISRIMEYTGMKKEEADQAADGILKLQKDLAGSALPLSKQGDPDVIYNPYTSEELKKLFPDGTMETFLKAADLNEQDQYNVVQVDQMKKIGEYLNQESSLF